MIQKGTRCTVLDNSGALEVEVFGIYGGTRKRTAYIGDIVKVAVKKIIPNNKNVKKGSVAKGVIVSAKYNSKNYDGGFSKFGINGIVLLKNNNEIMGTKVKGVVSRAAFENQHEASLKKILQYCDGVC